MHKTEIVKKVAKQTKQSQGAVLDVLNASLKVIEDSLAKKQPVRLIGFGTFYTRIRAQSEAVDFRTGEKITVPSMSVAAFRVGANLKKAVKSGKKKGSRKA